jgi:hypothetical protein
MTAVNILVAASWRINSKPKSAIPLPGSDRPRCLTVRGMEKGC